MRKEVQHHTISDVSVKKLYSESSTKFNSVSYNVIVSESVSKRAFTLIELLLVIGIISILAAIVITAVNPTQNLTSSRDSKRRSFQRELQNAAYQYIIDYSNEPGDKAIPTGRGNALPVCRLNLPGPNCISLDSLIPDYLSTLDVDISVTDPNYTGYKIYLQQGGFVRVFNDHIGSGAYTISLTNTFAGGVGSPGNPYQIENCAQLQEADNNLTSSFVLNRSINCDIAPYNSGEGFNPIGTNSTDYSGSQFDGQGIT